MRFSLGAMGCGWLSPAAASVLVLFLAGSLWARSGRGDRSVHEVIKPVPALSSITPSASSQSSTTVIMTVSGDGFVDGASLVQWDGKDLPTTFQSTSELEARISPTRLSSPGEHVITVFNPEPGGGTSTSMTFTVSEAETTVDFFVPVLVSSAGANDSFYTSELTLTNKGAVPVSLDLQYTAAAGFGTGMVASVQVPPGQSIEPDAIEYLRRVGMPIPGSGNRVGTLSVRASGTASPSDFAVTVRTTSTVPEGRAGMSYAAVPLPTGVLTGPSYLCGLKQSSTHRSNVAVQHAGQSGNITLRLTVFSGDATVTTPQLVSEVALPPGGFKQINSILHSEGLMLDSGYVRIEKLFGAAPYYAYGVISDQVSSDSSFVAPVRADWMSGRSGLTVPVIVEVGNYQSELVVSNWSSETRTVTFQFFDRDIPNGQLGFSMEMQAGSQQILGDFVEYLRGLGYTDDLPRGHPYAGPLVATLEGEGDGDGLFVGALTSSAVPEGGEYGVFYPAVPSGTAFTTGAWLYGLQQDSEDRTNLAVMTTSSADHNDNHYEIDLYDGSTNQKVETLSRIVPANEWIQIETILNHAEITQGYAHVRRTAGANDFITYAVINDGGTPQERTGDGAFVLGVADINP